MVSPETLSMKCRLDPTRVTEYRFAGFLVDVAGTALIHANARRQFLAVALRALVHFRQFEGSQRRAGGNRLMAGCAVHVELPPMTKMILVRKLNVLVLAGNHVGGRRNLP